MELHPLPLQETLDSLPPEWPHDPLPEIKAAIEASTSKIVVLDDDPTGTQTVANIPVLTDWSVERLSEELSNDLPVFYVLTNSRSMPPSEAEALNSEIGRNLSEAASRVGKEIIVASRSDSTLRGHFPGEVQAIADSVGQEFDGWLFTPYFLEGGRYTINDVHYVVEGDWLTPAGHTEFARDSAFPFSNSELHQWVEEKTTGRVSADDVIGISLEDIRQGGPNKVTERLMTVSNGAIFFVNAVSMRDMEVFVLGLLEAEKRGKRFLYRTAASFLRARFGQPGRSLLTAQELGTNGPGGALIVVGSHVPRTTTQLTHLIDNGDIHIIEVNVRSLLYRSAHDDEISRVTEDANEKLQEGKDVVIYTNREVITGENAEANLSISHQISQGLVEILGAISARPRYILTKGGITSSDLATQGLGVKRAIAQGQIYPGVPVWKLGPETRFPDLAYIIFPGNVGTAEAVTEVVSKLRNA